MNRTMIKTIAVIAMLFDHIALFFLPVATPAYFFLRAFGRITAILMTFFLVEGFIHTSSRSRYLLRLMLFTALSQIPYSVAMFGTVSLVRWNVLATFLLAFLMLWAMEQRPFLWLFYVMGLFFLSYFCDWGIIVPLLALLFYLYRDARAKQILVGAAAFGVWIATLFTLSVEAGKTAAQFPWWVCGMFLALPFIAVYNGRKGSSGAFYKWGFYILYPMQFLLFWAILRLCPGLR